MCRQALWSLSVLLLALPACAAPPDGRFRPTAPPEVAAGSSGAVRATRELVVNGSAVPFVVPDGPPLELVRLSVDGRQLPRGLVLAATLEWEGDRRVMVLDDEPGRTGQIGLRRHDPRWIAGDLVFAGGTEVWIGLEALAWSGADGLGHDAGRATSGRSIEPFLPMGFPHDKLVDLPVERAALSLYMVSPAEPVPATETESEAETASSR